MWIYVEHMINEETEEDIRLDSYMRERQRWKIGFLAKKGGDMDEFRGGANREGTL